MYVYTFIFMYSYVYIYIYMYINVCVNIHIGGTPSIYLSIYEYMYINMYTYRVALVSSIDKIKGLFCKRALQKKQYFAKETYNFKEPTSRSHPISELSICLYIYIHMYRQHCLFNHIYIDIYTYVYTYVYKP